MAIRQRGGQGRDVTRGLRSHEKEAAHRSACVRLPISNYLHMRVAFGARSILKLHGARESREFSIRGIIVNRASLFISVIIATLYLPYPCVKHTLVIFKLSSRYF